MTQSLDRSRKEVQLLDYAHPFRYLYAAFWGLVAGLSLYFLSWRPDPILWAALVASLVWGAITLLTRKTVWMTDEQLIARSVPQLWRPTRVWPLNEIYGAELESTLSLDDREVTRPLQYRVMIHEHSGRFRPLVVVHRLADAQRLITAIQEALLARKEGERPHETQGKNPAK